GLSQYDVLSVTFLVSGQCFLVTCHHIEYHLIEEAKTWDEAQRYCKEKREYTDLATVSDMTDMKRLREIVNTQEAWIGLQNTWNWSDGSNSSFRHWNLGLLKDGVKKECATVLKGEEKWDSAACDKKKPFVCYDGTFSKGLPRLFSPSSESEAVNYCRENHRDLVSITDLHQQRWVEARAKMPQPTMFGWDCATPVLWICGSGSMTIWSPTRIGLTQTESVTILSKRLFILSLKHLNKKKQTGDEEGRKEVRKEGKIVTSHL
uniref:C-type lectin domain-containing protein n=1 Tax=Labrus bergylta TaxID=56723 RepID=A0A3Q3FB91_9LABR